MSQFVHLHLHTDYSMLDGACDIDKLVSRAQAMGMPAVAMTDHGNIFGAFHFYQRGEECGDQADHRVRTVRLQESRPSH